MLVVGSEPADLFRALFYVDDPRASLLVIPAGSNYDLSTLPEDKEWALIIGDHSWTGGASSQSPTPGFALVRRDDEAVHVHFQDGRVVGVHSLDLDRHARWAAFRL